MECWSYGDTPALGAEPGVTPYPGRRLPSPCSSRPCLSSPELAQLPPPLPFGPASVCPAAVRCLPHPWVGPPLAAPTASPLRPRPCSPLGPRLLAPPRAGTALLKAAPHLEASLVSLGPRGMRSCHGLGGFSVPWGASAPSVGREAWHLRGREGEDLGDRGRAAQSLPESSGQGLPGQHSELSGVGGGRWEDCARTSAHVGLAHSAIGPGIEARGGRSHLA